jgi:acetyl-CoA carboxylase biotin carboxyl carrier protein
LANASGAWLEAVRLVVAAVRSSDVTELELAHAGFSIRVRREPGVVAPAAAESERPETQFQQVVAPFTGVFYRSPTPSARPYVDEGEWVDPEAVIGLVETMKIFNEVTADVSGRIVRFVAESGQLVHAGDVLVLVEPGERATADAGQGQVWPDE